MDDKLPCRRMSGMSFGGGIRDMLARADELARQGRSVLHLEIGRPDLDSPAAAKAAAARALDAGQVHYADMAGIEELRRELAAKYRREWGIALDIAQDIVVTSGAIEALMTTFLTLIDPGDEVIVPSPFFPVYDDQIKMCGGTLVPVPCSLEHDLRPQPEDIERAITPRTRAILINTPNNPTGAVSTRAELEGIAAIAQKHDLIVISDECYEKFAYDPETPHISIASLPGMRERTFTISSASKTYSMTGWRVGWLIIPTGTKKYIIRSHQGVATCSNTFAQFGAAEALRSCSSDVDSMIAEYRRRRDFMVDRLRAIDGFDVPTPNGAFYVFPSIKRLGISSFDFATRLLEERGVAVVPGKPFGSDDCFLRLTYCRPILEIDEALTRMQAFVADLRSR